MEVIVKKNQASLQVTFEDGKMAQFEDCWLRDHCRCSNCYHAETFQRAVHILNIPDSRIDEVTTKPGSILIKWDDGHESEYDKKFLEQLHYDTWKPRQRLKPILWKGSTVSEKIAIVNVEKFVSTTEGAKIIFQSLLDYGISLIEGVEPTLEATERVCSALGGVQQTLFGGMWQFTTKADHADTAYTNLPLAVHNDNTYFTEAAGLQVLHCLEHTNGFGGETVLVDGFYGAKKLKKEHPEDFKFLSDFEVTAEYIEDNHHHKYSAPVIIKDNNSEEVKQIRFNVYDRAPMAFSSSEECRAYYRAFRNLSGYYENSDYTWTFKLKPGTLLVIDNFRVLHGRTGFTGSRVLAGSYVSRSDWLDRARTLELIH